MSQKRKNQRAKHDEEEKQKAEKVVKWIFGILIVLALCYAIYMGTLMS